MCCLPSHALYVLCPSGLLSERSSAGQLTAGGHVLTETTFSLITGWQLQFPTSENHRRMKIFQPPSVRWDSVVQESRQEVAGIQTFFDVTCAKSRWDSTARCFC